MSVVVKRLKSSSMEIYVKGAPEVMNDICDRDSRKYLTTPAFTVLTSIQCLRITTISYHTTQSVDTELLPLLERVSKACHGSRRKRLAL